MLVSSVVNSWFEYSALRGEHGSARGNPAVRLVALSVGLGLDCLKLTVVSLGDLSHLGRNRRKLFVSPGRLVTLLDFQIQWLLLLFGGLLLLSNQVIQDVRCTIVLPGSAPSRCVAWRMEESLGAWATPGAESHRAILN